jgi:hypothetical protein
MSKASAIRATYSDWKLVKTRGVVQIVFEVPLAEADMAYEVIGGMPNPSNERWFGIAALDLTQKHIDARPVKPKRDWRDLVPSAQASIRCDEPIFEAFLKEEYPDIWREMGDAVATVRSICAVNSRADLNTFHASRVIWHQLDEKFQAWKAAEHA